MGTPALILACETTPASDQYELKRMLVLLGVKHRTAWLNLEQMSDSPVGPGGMLMWMKLPLSYFLQKRMRMYFVFSIFP